MEMEYYIKQTILFMKANGNKVKKTDSENLNFLIVKYIKDYLKMETSMGMENKLLKMEICMKVTIN
jgi:hypothetical protein